VQDLLVSDLFLYPPAWIQPRGRTRSDNGVLECSPVIATPRLDASEVAMPWTIPGDLYEAASIDGAAAVRKFFSLTLPLIMPTLVVALIFRTLDALRVLYWV
jgi:ABC-type molybdate transport system permease subunit